MASYNAVNTEHQRRDGIAGILSHIQIHLTPSYSCEIAILMLNIFQLDLSPSFHLLLRCNAWRCCQVMTWKEFPSATKLASFPHSLPFSWAVSYHCSHIHPYPTPLAIKLSSLLQHPILLTLQLHTPIHIVPWGADPQKSSCGSC